MPQAQSYQERDIERFAAHFPANVDLNLCS